MYPMKYHNHLLPPAYHRPVFFHPLIGFSDHHEIDQGTAAYEICDNMATPAHPVIHDGLEMIFRQRTDRDQRTPTHVARKADTLLAVKCGTHQRTNDVASDQAMEQLAPATADLDGRPFFCGLYCNTGCVQADIGVAQRPREYVKQVGAVDLKPAGAKPFGHGPLGLGTEQDLPGDHVARQHETRLKPTLADHILDAESAQDHGQVGRNLNTGGDIPAPTSLSLPAGSNTTGSKPR